MSKAFKTVLDQVHLLSKAEQLALMELIVRLLKEEEGEEISLSPEWEAELARRDALLKEEKMPLYSWDEVKSRIINRNKSA